MYYTFPTAALTVLKAQYGAASATASIQFFTASSAATATYAVTATGSIGSATPYSVPLTTKTATVTVSVVSGSAALQDYPVTFTTTWTGAAAGDVTPVSGATGSSVVRTDVNGKASLVVTNNVPADGAKASVAISIGGTAGTTQVIDWVKSKPASVTVDPEGPMTVALKAATKATFTVLDAFGKPVVGEVVNLSVTGSNNTTASPLRPASVITDANGQVSYTLTDALAIAAGTDVITATTTSVAQSASLSLTYAATAPAAAAMKVYYDNDETTWSTLVPSTTIFDAANATPNTGFTLNQTKDITSSLIPTSGVTTDDVIGFKAFTGTAASVAVGGVPVTVSVSAGGWLLSSAGLPVTSRPLPWSHASAAARSSSSWAL
jgi:hypothetical protein